MKKILLSLLLVSAGFMVSWSQGSKSLKKIIELKIPGEGGANGAQVAWHPVQKKYYAAMAGNTQFSLGVYDISGKLLSPTTQQTLFDIRGMWYNPATKTIQMNGYDDFGWAEYKLDAKGFPLDYGELQEGMHQPAAQAAGAFDAKEKVVYFLSDEGSIEKYSFAEGEYLELIELALGKTKTDVTDKTFSQANDEVYEEYNSSTLIFTGISGAEIGLLNHYKKQVELYSLATGYMTRKLALPEGAPAQEILNFSYCNGIYWLFDKEARVWKGYK